MKYEFERFNFLYPYSLRLEYDLAIAINVQGLFGCTSASLPIKTMLYYYYAPDAILDFGLYRRDLIDILYPKK